MSCGGKDIVQSTPFRIGPRVTYEKMIRAHPNATAYTHSFTFLPGYHLARRRTNDLGNLIDGVGDSGWKPVTRRWTPFLFNCSVLVAVVAFLIAIIHAYTV